MSRKSRNLLNFTYYHIITQGINKSFIFENETDVKHYISLIYKLKEEYALEIIAYCIMGNHLHMLLKISHIDKLSMYMHRVNTSYAIYYNKKYNRVGPVFRDRFKSQVITDESHMYNCINYIFNNPVKAGICQKASDYKYSNYFKIERDEIDDYKFIDCDEENTNLCIQLVNDFLKINKIQIEQLKQNKEKLKELVHIVKIQYGISYRKLSAVINVSKDILRRLCE